MSNAAAVFAAVFIALYVAHSVGDHWVQTSHQAAHKGEHDRNPGQSSRTGRLSCTLHVLGLTITKAVVLIPVVLVLDLSVTTGGIAAGLGIDAVSHWWADRRSTLAWDPGELHLMQTRALVAGPELREVYRLAA
ncbi:ABC-type Fe3+ transport system permease subunit [Streptomyces sp. B4I13]|uniref:hypothetical protein n=1 Tax=Streptomyces sp. B4I13 TaxID=3042271 RepID=UPI00278726A4|nr:hypothetical protein [Streptomyces sp. B4I13]MDQ0964577.1 ABC-type Fe3+ transport system permease subunit [Streptomyces sp. B4I13]